MERRDFLALSGLSLAVGACSGNVTVDTQPGASGQAGRFYPAVTQTSAARFQVIHDRATFVDQYKYDHWTDPSADWKKDNDLFCELSGQWGRMETPIQRRPGEILPGLWLLGPEDYHQSIYLMDTGEGLLLVDPSYTRFQPHIEVQIRQLGFPLEKVRWVLLTHMHFDHSEAAAAWERRGAEVFVPEGDAPYVTGKIKAQAGDIPDPVKSPTTFGEGAPLTFGRASLTVIHTPGHTPGGCCYGLTWDGKPGLISGDIALHLGRHAWMGADYCNWDQYLASLWKLYRHPECEGWQFMLPGHGSVDLDGARDSLYRVILVVSEVIRQRRAGSTIDWIDPLELFWRRRLEGKPEIEPLEV